MGVDGEQGKLVIHRTFLPSMMTKPRGRQSAGCAILLSGLALLLQLVGTDSVYAQQISGRAVSVQAGDAITILNKQNELVRIILYGIDAPEKRQPFFRKAKQFTESLLKDKTVLIHHFETDDYQRVIGIVHVGSTNVNETLLQNGFAWKHASGCTADFCHDWKQMQDSARTAGLGLWSQKNPQPPWERRKIKRIEKCD